MIVTVTGLASKSPALSVALTVKAYFRLEAVAALTKIFLAEIERFLCAVAGSGTTPLVSSPPSDTSQFSAGVRARAG